MEERPEELKCEKRLSVLQYNAAYGPAPPPLGSDMDVLSFTKTTEPSSESLFAEGTPAHSRSTLTEGKNALAFTELAKQSDQDALHAESLYGTDACNGPPHRWSSDCQPDRHGREKKTNAGATYIIAMIAFLALGATIVLAFLFAVQNNRIVDMELKLASKTLERKFTPEPNVMKAPSRVDDKSSNQQTLESKTNLSGRALRPEQQAAFQDTLGIIAEQSNTTSALQRTLAHERALLEKYREKLSEQKKSLDLNSKSIDFLRRVVKRELLNLQDAWRELQKRLTKQVSSDRAHLIALTKRVTRLAAKVDHHRPVP